MAMYIYPSLSSSCNCILAHCLADNGQKLIIPVSQQFSDTRNLLLKCMFTHRIDSLLLLCLYYVSGINLCVKRFQCCLMPGC